ncbi:hypothetical protein ACEYW6_02395 [Nostoc sp. UIC 10607]
MRFINLPAKGSKSGSQGFSRYQKICDGPATSQSLNIYGEEVKSDR